MKRKVAIPEKIKGPRLFTSTWKQNPVVDSTKGKFTTVSLISYYHTTGFSMRSPGKETLVGYCVQSPQEVLEAAFENYHVTCYDGYELFGSEDFESTTPMLGLGISPINPPKIYGIEYNGKLETLLQLDELLNVKRDKPISSQDIQRILDYIGKESKNGFMNPNNNQKKHDKQEIINIIKRFG